MIEQTKAEMGRIGQALQEKRAKFGELWNKYTQGAV
jgi:hypothetical protein